MIDFIGFITLLLSGAKHDLISRTHECSPDDGYIMSSRPRLNDKSSQWSNCSVKDIQEFLDTHPTCLNNNKFGPREVLPVYLPGRFMNVHEQCQRLVGTRACKLDSSICWALSCNSENGGSCTKMHNAAADGFTPLFWGFAALYVANAGQLHRIHKRMTPSERMKIFKTTEENVPDYEITGIHWPRDQKSSVKDGTGMYLKAFGKNIQLWLTPADRALAGRDTPVYSLVSGGWGPILMKYTKVIKTVERFEDLEKSAVLVISQRSDNSRAMIGTIASENLVITPIPERLVDEVKRRRRSVDDVPESEQDDHHYHIVYKGSPVDDRYSDSFMSKRNTANLWTAQLPENMDLGECSRAHRMCVHRCGDLSMIDDWKVYGECAKCQEYRRDFTEQCPLRPDTVYPRILVIVAHDFYQKFHKNYVDTIAYLLAFWNGVDLKYRYFENPKFRLNIAGIVLTEDAEALEYMTTNVIDESTIEAFKTLDGSESYWYARKADIPFDNYDVIVTMTSTNMCSFPSDIMNGVCESGILGVANVGAACTGSDFRGELLNVAIVQDQSAFNGIHTAAHELAHLFGAKHDEISRTHECSPDDGYIMSSGPRLNDKSSQWSSCTVKDIQEFLDTHPKCLNNKINQRKILPVYLPGRFMNAHEQCHRLVGTKACKTAASICWALSCKDLLWEDCMEMRHPAADGTTCGSGKICLYGECVDESTVYA